MRFYVIMTLALVWALQAAGNVAAAQYPVPTILRTSNPDRLGHFGLACSIDNGRAAVCSKEIFFNPTEYGGVAIFERDSAGRWLQTQILRASQTALLFSVGLLLTLRSLGTH
ncbi:MAG: hypothetical protein R3F49_23245 [Planctomycetota bacterium]